MSDGIEVVGDTPEELRTSDTLFKSDTERQAFSDFLVKEIKAVRDGAELQELKDNIQKWRRMRIARPETSTKDYPFPGSSNVSPPIMAQRVNTVYAKLLKNFSTKRPFWSGDSADSKYKPHAEALAKYLNMLSSSPFHLNLDAINRKAFYDLPSLGTQFYEISWEYRQVPYLNGESQDYRVVQNGPSIELIKIEDFLTRPYWDDLQRAPWIAIKFKLTWSELKEKGASGRYANVDQVLDYFMKEFSEEEKSEFERQGINPEVAQDCDTTKIFELYRFHAFWDTNGDGILEDIKGVIELESGTILRIEPNNIGWRLIGRIPFFEIPGNLYGIGLGHQLEFLQDEGETLHNMRLDNLQLAMIKMFKARRGSGIDPNETFYPGKIFFTDQPEDFGVLEFPDLSNSSYMAENLVNQYADRISGANDALAGQADMTLKSGGGAEAQKFMASMASTILDAQFDTVETYYAEMGRMLVILLSANKSLVDYSMVSEEEAKLIQEVLSLDSNELPFKFKFKIETTDVARSEEMRKQNFAQFMSVYNTYGTVVGQYITASAKFAQVLPQAAEIYLKLVVGQTHILEKMIEFFNIGDKSKYLPFVGDIEALLTQREMQREASVGQTVQNNTEVAGVGGNLGPAMVQNSAGPTGSPAQPQGPSGGASF